MLRSCPISLPLPPEFQSINVDEVNHPDGIIYPMDVFHNPREIDFDSNTCSILGDYREPRNNDSLDNRIFITHGAVPIPNGQLAAAELEISDNNYAYRVTGFGVSDGRLIGPLERYRVIEDHFHKPFDK